MKPKFHRKTIWYRNQRELGAGAKEESKKGWYLISVDKCRPEGNWLERLASIITNRSRFEFEATYKKEIRGRY